MWKDFNKTINDLILANSNAISSEDKRLGVYFVHEKDIDITNKDVDKMAERFAGKVIKYLWDDAFKFTRDKVFDVATYKSLEDVISEFVKAKGKGRFDIFLKSVADSL